MPGVPCQIEREREEHLDPSHKSPFARAMIGKLEKAVAKQFKDQSPDRKHQVASAVRVAG
jgi:hypothetical protein